MFCFKCGASLPGDANFCFKCGCDLRDLNQESETGESETGLESETGESETGGSAVKTGGIVEFGNYFQNNKCRYNKEPIEWLVLEVKGNEALLISRYGLDCQRYHDKRKGTTWENCSLRYWLNNYFLYAAFSDKERERIVVSDVVNDGNWRCGTSGGSNTRDLIFCLSLAEAEQYFNDENEGQCWPTEYARSQGVDDERFGGVCAWWLRSPGCEQNFASYFYNEGVVPIGASACLPVLAVRPALWVKLRPSQHSSERSGSKFAKLLSGWF
jgi:hypothetical protein